MASTCTHSNPQSYGCPSSTGFISPAGGQRRHATELQQLSCLLPQAAAAQANCKACNAKGRGPATLGSSRVWFDLHPLAATW